MSDTATLGPSPAELAALRAVLAMGSVKAAAHSLGKSQGTIKHQLASARRRADVETNAQLALAWQEWL